MTGVIDAAVVWNEPALFESMRAHAAGTPDLRIRAASTSGLLRGTQPRPDVVVIEVSPRDGADPVAGVRSLCRAGHRVLAVSRGADPCLVAALLGTGACLLIGTDQTAAAVAAAIRATGPGHGAGAGAARPRLSPREQSVLTAYTSGMTLDAVARQVGIRPSTAKTYLERVKAKYRETGRAAYTKLELMQRANEDSVRAPGS